MTGWFWLLSRLFVTGDCWVPEAQRQPIVELIFVNCKAPFFQTDANRSLGSERVVKASKRLVFGHGALRRRKQLVQFIQTDGQR